MKAVPWAWPWLIPRIAVSPRRTAPLRSVLLFLFIGLRFLRFGLLGLLPRSGWVVFFVWVGLGRRLGSCPTGGRGPDCAPEAERSPRLECLADTWFSSFYRHGSKEY